MRAIVIGAGGVGGWLTAGVAATMAHARELEGQDRVLVIVDGDHFEPKNMARQHFQALGNKATVRAAELTPLYPKVDIIDMPMWVVETIPEGANDDEDAPPEENTKAITATALLEDGDVVFAVVDNFACRATIIAAAAELPNVDVLLAGNDDAWYASCYHYQRRDGEDVTDNPLWKPELADPSDRNPGELSCAERAAIEGGTQNIWTNMLAAAVAGSKFVEAILRGNRHPEADEILHDLDKGRAGGFDRTSDAAKARAAQAAPAEDAKEAPSTTEPQPA